MAVVGGRSLSVRSPCGKGRFVPIRPSFWGLEMNYDVIREYMARVQKVYATGETTEHSFRPALQYLFDHITDDVECVNEPKMVTDVGRPDFVFKRTVGENLITVGHCEAKDIDKDVDPRAMNDANKEQFRRYVKGLPNLIYTNGLDFRFYVEGKDPIEVSIADYAVGISPKPERYPEFMQRLQDFARQRVQTITSPERLAKLMAGKAILVKTALFRTLRQDEDLRTELGGQYKAFKDQLIHDLTPEGFADIYAETVAYGMFAARLHDETPDDFSREEALALLPKSNPFLRKLFEFIARQDLDPRIKGDIDELAEIFQATNLQHLFENFGSFTQRNDPFIHFYEDFLKEYNPKKKTRRGVWYTPKPVVDFIVPRCRRRVDIRVRPCRRTGRHVQNHPQSRYRTDPHHAQRQDRGRHREARNAPCASP